MHLHLTVMVRKYVLNQGNRSHLHIVNRPSDNEEFIIQ